MGILTVGKHPYVGLPEQRYWRSGVAACAGDVMSGLYVPKFEISASDKVATAGSCFAQHIARHMRATSFEVLDMEPGPPALVSGAFGYGLYSARYGNIYHARALLQLAREAFGEFKPVDWVWQSDDCFFDAFRQTIEPGGYASVEEVQQQRVHHLKRVRLLFESMDVLVFTLGLTEAWLCEAGGYVVSAAPGVVAEPMDASRVSFHNFRHSEIVEDLRAFLALVRNFNPGLKVILTVSPVPLVATASADHVLPATVYSKSVLRAAAGEVAAEDEHVAYFPSYEIIAGAQARGQFFEANLRSVSQAGVQFVMQHFFEAHPPYSPPIRDESKPGDEEEICDEIMNDAFVAERNHG